MSRKYRADGIRSIADLQGRCKRDERTGCLVWCGSVSNGSANVWLPALGQAHSVTRAFAIFKPEGLKPGQLWYAVCGNVLCADETHRKPGTKSDLMRASRPKLDEVHKQKIGAKKRQQAGFYSPELHARILNDETPALQLAKEIGLHNSMISRIRQGKAWNTSAVGSSVWSWRP